MSRIRLRYEFMEGIGALGSGAISVVRVTTRCGRRFSFTHSGTITALKSSWTEMPLFLAWYDMLRKVSSPIESMILFIV